MIDTFLYTVLMFFCCTGTHVQMPKGFEIKDKRMKAAALQHTPIFYNNGVSCYCYVKINTISWNKGNPIGPHRK